MTSQGKIQKANINVFDMATTEWVNVGKEGLFYKPARVDLESGKILEVQSFETPQRFAGTGIMARIQYDTEQGGHLLQRTLLAYLGHAIEAFSCDRQTIYEIVIAATVGRNRKVNRRWAECISDSLRAHRIASGSQIIERVLSEARCI